MRSFALLGILLTTLLAVFTPLNARAETILYQQSTNSSVYTQNFFSVGAVGWRINPDTDYLQVDTFRIGGSCQTAGTVDMYVYDDTTDTTIASSTYSRANEGDCGTETPDTPLWFDFTIDTPVDLLASNQYLVYFIPTAYPYGSTVSYYVANQPTGGAVWGSVSGGPSSPSFSTGAFGGSAYTYLQIVSSAELPPNRNKNTPFITIVKPQYNEMVDNEHDIEIEIKNPQFLDQEYITYYNVYIRDYLTNITEYNYVGEMGTTTADQTLLATASTTDGSKFITVDMWTDVRDYPKASGFYNVNVNTYLENTGLETPTAPPTGLSVINCTTFDFGCQIQRAFTFLFVPDRGLVTTLLDIEDQLQEKIPFKYFYGTVQMWEDLSLSTTTLHSLPITYWNGEQTFDILSTTTIDTFVPTSVINLFKTLATATTWLAVLFYFWQMRLRVFNTKS